MTILKLLEKGDMVRTKVEVHKQVQTRLRRYLWEAENGRLLEAVERIFNVDRVCAVSTLSIQCKSLKAFSTLDRAESVLEIVKQVNARLFTQTEMLPLLEILSKAYGKRKMVEEVVYWRIFSELNLEEVVLKIGSTFKNKRALHCLMKDDLTAKSYRILLRNGFKRMKGTGVLLAGGIGKWRRGKLRVRYENE